LRAGVHVERVSAQGVLDDPYAIAHWAQELAAERDRNNRRKPLSQLR